MKMKDKNHEWEYEFNLFLYYLKKYEIFTPYYESHITIDHLPTDIFQLNLDRFKKTPIGYRIWKWIKTQKDKYEKDELSLSQIIKLESIPGWYWKWGLRPNERNSFTERLGKYTSRKSWDYDFLEAEDFWISSNSLKGKMLKIRKEIYRIDQFSDCSNFYCTTCGGRYHYIRSKISSDMKVQMKTIVALAPHKLIEGMFGEYAGLLFELNTKAYQNSKKDEINKYVMDLEYGGHSFNVAHESFLLTNKDYKDSEDDFYKSGWHKILSIGLKTMTEKLDNDIDDESLFETMLVILKENAIKYPKLVDYGLTKMRESEAWEKLMYNSLRENIPAVRYYVGSGENYYY